MNILTTLIEVLKYMPELPGLFIAALIPIVVPLYGKYLDKRKKEASSRGSETITITSSIGESIKIKLGNMTDEEEEQILQRLREMAARAEAQTT